jgi:hypothetical protein
VNTDERTTGVGLFNYAASYRSAADALGTVKFNATHPHAPRNFLYVHAIELYLKAFLRVSGHSVKDIEKLGHNWRRLQSAFARASGFLEDEDVEVLAILASTNASVRFRYIETGLMRFPTTPALARTAKSLNETVRSALKKLGNPVR